MSDIETSEDDESFTIDRYQMGYRKALKNAPECLCEISNVNNDIGSIKINKFCKFHGALIS